MNGLRARCASAIAMCLVAAACERESEPTGLGSPEESTIAELTDRVGDLHVVDRSGQSLRVEWTQVDDGTGSPARYRVKYGTPTIGYYGTARIGCGVTGTEIGAPTSCTIDQLQPNTQYQIQLAAYKLVDGRWTGTTFSNVVTTTTTALGGAVDDLRVRDRLAQDVTSTSIVVEWTQVDDGTGEGARYRVKYDSPTVEWKTGTIGCGVQGWDDHSIIQCVVRGLTPATDYEFQLMSYRLEDGVWRNAKYSNKAQGRTED